MDLISVIVPIYNVEPYLRECLDSILSQSYKNLEIIMVDDGSQDNCGIICDEYAAKHHNFKVIHKKNQGLGLARNTGLEYVTGKYVMFMDSDDYIDSDLIELLHSTIENNHVDCVKSGFRHVNNEKRLLGTTNYSNETFKGNEAKLEFAPRLIASAPNKKDSFEPSVCASLYKTDIIINNKLRFLLEKNPATSCEDLIFNLEYLQLANGACSISNIGYNYRYNDKSISSSYRSDRLDNSFSLYEYVKKALTDLNYNELAFSRLDTMMFVKIRKCISHEKKSISGHSVSKSLNIIKNICKDYRVQKITREYLLNNKIILNRRIFLYMIKYKMYRLLYICASINIF